MREESGSFEMPSRIEDYALIGDCETVALVGRDCSIDWLCWPNFASNACFAALLGNAENGRWIIAPAAPFTSSRRYREQTLILETTFENEEGAVTLIDFMPIRSKNSDVVRIAKGVRGRVRMSMELVLRFDNGRSIPWVTRLDDEGIHAVAGPDLTILRTSVPLQGENMRTFGEFAVSAGETVSFALTYGESYKPIPRRIDCEEALHQTEQFWRRWVRGAKCHEEYRPQVERSLITLKALTYRPTGGIVAAATTSLPEWIGGARNWDYRYCWLRDATFTLLVLMNSGFYDEARAWRDWLLRAAAGSPDQIQIMYGIHGERNLREWEVDWLAGYENSRPVRVGNAAANQLQLDVYGEVADALLHAHLGGIETGEGDWNLLATMTNHLAGIWQNPDEGIWEMRGGRKHFTYSKVMAWVAFDRTIQNQVRFGLKGPIAKWREMRAKIHAEVCREAWNPELGSFTQSYGDKQLDASLLLLPLVGFLPPHDPRILSTVNAIQKHLMQDGLLLRYNTATEDDGLPPGEGAFIACSFWLVNVLCLMGRRDEAKRKFEELLTLCNDVGLLAEEYDPRQKRQLGNFPQALSHISLINAALEFKEGLAPSAQRAKSGGSTADKQPSPGT